LKKHWPGRKRTAKSGREFNPPDKQRSQEQKNKDWETVVKMTIIARDLMIEILVW
jgi:L-fucose isomerase